MNEVQTHRETAQPIREKTGGSTFKNPPGNSAWKLIDAAGCRGLKLGGAQVSEMHCNFLINTGNATGHDIEALGETVRERVKQNSGIELHWEIKRIGDSSGHNAHHHSLRRNQQGAAGVGRERAGAVRGVAGGRSLVLGRRRQRA